VVDVGFVGTRADARKLRRGLVRDGFAARIERVRGRAQDDPERGPLGFLVRSGRFATEAEAEALRERLTAAGRTGLRVVFTGEDGGPDVRPVGRQRPGHRSGPLRRDGRTPPWRRTWCPVASRSARWPAAAPRWRR
jgi:hypothetical protein